MADFVPCDRLLQKTYSADQGGGYPQGTKAEVYNTLRDLQHSSYPTKAEFNNCVKFKDFKGKNELFVFLLTKITQPRSHGLSVNGSISCSGLQF